MWEINRESDMHLSKRDREFIGILAFVGNTNAHTWNVVLTDDQQPIDTSGKNVKGVFIYQDGTRHEVEGSFADNMAKVVLPLEIYAQAGYVRAVMRVTWDVRVVTVDSIAFRIDE